MSTVAIPYIDSILEELQRGNQTLAAVFGSHIHWGYWDDCEQADGSIADFVRASTRMSERVIDLAVVANGQAVVDVGCGFGGTVAALNHRLCDAHIVGLNIDPRQLERARTLVSQRNGNQVAFVEGDACRMPLETRSADVMMALECVFHFSDREKFLAEAARVLRPGGRLVVSDFVPAHAFATAYQAWFEVNARTTHGHVDVGCSLRRYGQIANEHGLTLETALDITPHTTPSYEALRPVARPEAVPVMRALELGARLELLRYMVLRFDRRV